ncbi:MAG TPA: hypothetical protein VJT73_10705 [Polyangiaceae bacterium]|nr:hypothetical protein [Polyangiaceae bacterium]
MAYLLTEHWEDGATSILGDAIHDLVVAKVIAARRATRSRSMVTVIDDKTGQELARFDGAVFVPTQSAQRMRAVDPEAEGPPTTLTRRKVSAR